MASTRARVDIRILDNATFQDAFQFGVSTDTSWSFTAKTFACDIKGDKEDASPLLSLTSGASQIVVDDAVLRVLHFNVKDTDLRAALVPGDYFYDLIMIDGSTPPIRTPLMGGRLCVQRGITAP